MFYFIVNPAAAGGRAEKIITLTEEHMKTVGFSDYKIIRTEYPKHAVEIAFGLVKSGVSDIVCCGGDGTINEIVNGVMLAGGKEGVCLGFLPCGTGNDFMRSAGLSLEPEKAVDALLGGRKKGVDVIDINGIKQICFSNAGFDAEVVRLCNSEKRKSKSSYTKNLLKSLNNAEYSFDIITDGGSYNGKGVLVSVLNGWSVGSGIKYCPTAEIDDGYMDVLVITATKKPQLLGCFVKAFRGKLPDSKHVEYFRCKTAEIKTSADVVDIDGELYYGLEYKAAVKEKVLHIYY